jgi:hypothetical protein
MASSSHRNPKELKDFIEKSKQDSARNYRNEIDLKNAKIEEQNKLIAFYKQRGDDYLKKIQSLERANQIIWEQKPFYRWHYRLDAKRYRSEAYFVDALARELERTDVEVMRSRTDEQSSLILFYKNRGDEHIRKLANLEKLNQDLLEQKEQLEKDFANLNSKLSKKKLEYEDKIKSLMQNLNNEEKNLLELNMNNEKKLENVKKEFEQAMTLNKKEYNELRVKKNKEIADINLQLQEKVNENEEIKLVLGERTKELVELKSKLAEKNSETAKLKMEIIEKERKVL